VHASFAVGAFDRCLVASSRERRVSRRTVILRLAARRNACTAVLLLVSWYDRSFARLRRRQRHFHTASARRCCRACGQFEGIARGKGLSTSTSKRRKELPIFSGCYSSVLWAAMRGSMNLCCRAFCTIWCIVSFLFCMCHRLHAIPATICKFTMP
jgi:hypothetical protein